MGSREKAETNRENMGKMVNLEKCRNAVQNRRQWAAKVNASVAGKG